jgi:DNA (cytosine-5)-methyltransferase 1
MKPLYSVPLLEEISRAPRNGFTVASTFAGGGGSSTGYRISGFSVLWANEIAEAARATYSANMADYTCLDGRSIRDVTPEDVLEKTGLEAGQLDIFDGSPPCDSFTTIGARQAKWGKVKSSADTKQRTDDLFFEYIRLLRGLRPKTFVAENVSGLVKGAAKGYFLEILAALKASGYQVRAQLLDAQWLGVPQARERVIFVGVRDDLDIPPPFPRPRAYHYTVRDALPHVRQHGTAPKFRVFAEGGRKVESTLVDSSRYAAPTITGGENLGTGYVLDFGAKAPRKMTIAELKRICSFPDDYELRGTEEQQWQRMGLSVPPMMVAAISAAIRDEVLEPLRMRNAA